MNTPEEMFKAVGLENPHDKESNTRGCKDGGVCHHNCSDGCFREKYCVPLAISNLDDNWQPLKAGDFQELKNQLIEKEDTLSRTKAELEEARKLLNGMVLGVGYFHRTHGSMNELLKAYSESREFLSNQPNESSEE